MFRKATFYLILVLTLFVASCTAKESEINVNVNANSQQQPEKLVVYLSAIQHGFQSKNDSGEISVEYLYPSKHLLGMTMVGGELECAGGNVFAQALQEYSNMTGIKIEIHYVEEYSGESDIFQNLAEQDSLPDLILLNKHSRYDYFNWSENSMLIDFSTYMDDALYNENQYYQEVIEGGKIKDKQVILPILFNMNGMISSQSYLEKIECDGLLEEISYENALYILEKSCLTMTDIQTKEAIFDTSGMMNGGRYIPNILLSAAYSSYFDDNNSSIELSPDVVSNILNLMLLYNEQEFGADPNWEENSYLENLSNYNAKSNMLLTLEKGLFEEVGVFLSGGRSGGANFHSSILTDAAYFNSMYNEVDEEMVLYGIPMEDDSNAYSANISVFAAGFSSTKYPEAVYDLARFLMDYEYSSAYGFSVNKEITNKQLEDIQKTTTTVYSDSIWSTVTFGLKSEDEIEKDIEVIAPLEGRYVEQIRYMLDHIGRAGIPFGVLEYQILNVALQRTADGEMSCREAGEWVVNVLDEYLHTRKEFNPFYDSGLEVYIKDFK